MSKIFVRLMALMLFVSFAVQAEVSVPSIFGSRMVLQRGQLLPRRLPSPPPPRQPGRSSIARLQSRLNRALAQGDDAAALSLLLR